MGSLRRFVLSDEFVRRFPHFIETGTNWGESLRYAARHPFKTLSSVELDLRHYDDVMTRDWDERVKIVFGASAARLWTMLRHIPHDEGILFWLDAHFPQSRTDQTAWGAPLCWPLVDELNIIAGARLPGRDAILIDDWRIYSDEHCDKGPPDPPAMRAPEFVRPGPPPAWALTAYFEHDEGYQYWFPAGAPMLIAAGEWQ